MTAIQRDGETRAQVIPNVGGASVAPFIEEHVMDGSTLYTDGAVHKYPSRFLKRDSVNHKRKEWARGDVHINNVESFNGHIKRSIRGIYKSVSKAYFQEYLTAYAWHRNNRHNDRMRFGVLLAGIARLA